MITNKTVYALSLLLFVVSMTIFKFTDAWYLVIPAVIGVIYSVEWNYEVNMSKISKVNWLNKE